MVKAEFWASRNSHTPALDPAFIPQPQGDGMSPDQSRKQIPVFLELVLIWIGKSLHSSSNVTFRKSIC